MNMITEMILMRPDELKLDGSHARVHPREQIEALKKSLLEFGFVLPLLIDSENVLAKGRAILIAAQELGFERVPCVRADWFTETQRRGFALAHDRLAEMASWDKSGVSEELLYLQENGFDITLTGFEDDDIVLEESNDAVEDDFDFQLPKEPVCKRGQIWQLGRHRLMCGDATRAADVEQLMAGAKAQLLLTDPPYNVDVTGGTTAHLKIENDNMSENEFLDFLEDAFENAMNALEPGASFYIWHPDGNQGWAFRNACRRIGFDVRQCLVWVKNSATLGRQDYHWQHEPCLHGQTDPDDYLECGDTWNDHDACLYGWKDGSAHRWCSDRKQTTVLEFDRPARNDSHPTMKPVRLMAYQICNSTLRDAKVLDLFAGSGTTAIACEQLGRTAYLMELDPAYADVIISRWEAFSGEKAVLLDAT